MIRLLYFFLNIQAFVDDPSVLTTLCENGCIQIIVDYIEECPEAVETFGGAETVEFFGIGKHIQGFFCWEGSSEASLVPDPFACRGERFSQPPMPKKDWE